VGIELDFGPVLEASPFILRGLAMTLYVTLASMAIALALGLLIALLRMARFKPVQLVAMGYIDFFRGLPQLAFLIWLYFGVTLAFSLHLSPLTAAIACFSIQESAYLAEIYRAGLQSIPREQNMAALSLGLSPVHTLFDVILPQALRVVTPAIGNDFIGMLKGSALVSILGVWDLMRVSQGRANYYFRPFEFLTTAAVIYILLALGLEQLFHRLEGRFKF
jgi:His/Glu/Gln/Arg/opine family amino acid ABC transporter permease subunit